MIDVSVIPTFLSADDAPSHHGPFTLRGVDPDTVTVSDLERTIVAALIDGPKDAVSDDDLNKHDGPPDDTPREVDGVAVGLSIGGAVLSKSSNACDSTLSQLPCILERRSRPDVADLPRKAPQVRVTVAQIQQAPGANAAEAKRGPQQERPLSTAERPLLTVHVVSQPIPYIITLQVHPTWLHNPKAFSVALMTTTVGDLKREIAHDTLLQRLTGADWSDIVLQTRAHIDDEDLDRRQNDDSEMLGRCQFEDGMGIVAYLRSAGVPPPIALEVTEFIGGDSYTIHEDAHATIDEVKASLQKLLHFPADRMGFIAQSWRDNFVDGDKTLTSYGIQSRATIYLTRRDAVLKNRDHAEEPGHVSPDDDALFVMSFAVADLNRSSGEIVKVVDAVGSVSFRQTEDEITLARPCLGALTVWAVNTRRACPDAPVARAIDEEDEEDEENRNLCVSERHAVPIDSVKVEIKTNTEPTFDSTGCTRASTIRRLRAIRSQLLVTDLDFNHCHTSGEILKALYAQVAAKLPPAMVARGFDVYLVRPSGAEVLVDGIGPLLSPLNCQRALVVREVAHGARPAVVFDADDDTTTESSSGDEALLC